MQNSFIKLLISLALITSGISYAQSYEDFLKSQNSAKEKSIGTSKKAFDTYQQAQYKQFTAFLKAEWQTFKVQAGTKEDPNPKIDKPPIVVLPEKKVTEVIKTDKDIDFNIEGFPLLPVVFDIPSENTEERNLQEIEFKFYSQSIQWHLDKDWNSWLTESYDNVNKQRVVEFWQDFQHFSAEQLLTAMDKVSSKLELNDWGRLLLLRSFLKSQNYNDNQITLTLWGLMLKENKDVRLGYAENKAFLLFASDNKLFSNSFFTYDNKRYYVFSPAKRYRIKTLRSYKGELDEHAKALILTFNKAPFIGKGEEFRTLDVEWQSKKYQFKVPIYKSEINYLATMPQQELSNYFNYQPNVVLTKTLLPQLKEVIKNMETREQLNFLLRFSQKTFSYATDDQQFNKENYLLPEETIFYPASDCEDRVLFFTWLVRSLTNVKIIALLYPGHIASALAIDKEDDSEKSYNHQGEQYIIADPTYLNSLIGMEMPEMLLHTPKILTW